MEKRRHQESEKGTSHIVVNTYPVPRQFGVRQLQFAIGQTTTSFNVYIYSTDPRTIRFRLIAPDGSCFPDDHYRILYREIVHSRNAYWLRAEYCGGITVPIDTGKPTNIMGTWQCEIRLADNNVEAYMTVSERVYTQTKAQQAYNIPLKPIFIRRSDPGQIKLTAVKEELQYAKLTFSKVDLKLLMDPLQVLDMPEELDDKFYEDPTAKMVLNHTAKDTILLLIIENLKFVNILGALGISGGLPGPQGLIRSDGAVLVCFSPRATYYRGKLGLTIAHEIGHYLGLTHESVLWGVDPHLPESKKLEISYKHLMYYGASIGDEVNNAQRHIVRQQPIVKITTITKPVKNLVIRVYTGNRWPHIFDGPGTNMEVWLSLEGEDGKSEMFALPGPFSMNTTKNFELKPQWLQKDLVRWTISVSGTHWTRNWGGDVWHLDRLEIIADGENILDAKIDKFMGMGYVFDISDDFLFQPIPPQAITKQCSNND